MDKTSGENYLRELHEEIIISSRNYDLPWPILSLVNEEYLGYLQSTERNFYYQWLALLVKKIKPKLILELGNNLGMSTLMIFSQLPETSRFISIDLTKQLSFIPPEIFSDSRLRFYFGNDLNLNIFGDDLPIGIDILFIDTNHTYEQISAEWGIYRNLCNPGAIIILDDIRTNDMFDFWESLSYPKLELTEKCHESGFGFFLYTSDNRPDPLKACRAALQNVFERHDLLHEKHKEKTVSISAICRNIVNKLLLGEKKSSF